MQQAFEDRLMKFKEAMEYLRVSRSTLLRMMEREVIVGHKVGNTWRFWASDVKKCVQRSQPGRAEQGEGIGSLIEAAKEERASAEQAKSFLYHMTTEQGESAL